MSPNYHNTIIYKFYCIDENINDFYIGYTTNFEGRKGVHRRCCCNPKNNSYKNRMYTFIRNNGGWNNWEFTILENCNVDNKKQAREIEKNYIRRFNPTLNTNL
jgi:hypothetical protein